MDFEVGICCMFLNLTLLQYPTKALAPLMLEDYRKVMVDRRGEEQQFSSENIVECMNKGIWPSFLLLFSPCFIQVEELYRLHDGLQP